MTAIVRYSKVGNATGAALTAALANAGDDLADQTVRRDFVAADIGTGAGQTRDASDPTGGCLVAQFTGSRVLDVKISQPYRVTAATNRNFNAVVIGTGANTTSLGYRVVYNTQNGVTSIYIIDLAAAAPGRLVAGDWIYIEPLIGSSPTVTALG